MTLKQLLQFYLPQRSLSRLSGRLSESKVRWWKNFAIRYFIHRYQVDLSSALQENIEDYPNFNSFFTRSLKPSCRPIAEGEDNIISPVDGTISQIGKIRNDVLLQAKGSYYNLNALLGGIETHSRHFYDGSFITLYLAPKDYHRVHIPATGLLTETVYVPGKLFSVSPETSRTVPQLFTRNERLICIFETHFGPMAVILVGAMIVCGIKTIWPFTPSQRIDQQQYPPTLHLLKGNELGHFQVGSTVIVLFPKKTMHWSESLAEGSSVQMGQKIGVFSKEGQ